MKIKILLLQLLLLIPVIAIGQSDIKLSNFFLSPLIYNPAYAGSFEGMTFTSFYSTQWVGFEGAPNTAFINGHGTFLGPKTGIGAELIHDEFGITSDTKFLINYAYHLDLNAYWRLSLGVKTGFSWYSVDYNRLSIENPFEIQDGFERLNTMNFNFGAGFFIHNERFYFGVGVPNILRSNYLDAFRNTVANTRPNYYISSGYSLPVGDEIFLQPMLLTRITEGAPINTLLALTLNWQEKFYSSVNVDVESTLGAFIGVRPGEKLMIGYAYDTSINNFSRSNDGIHSFFLNLRLDDYWQRKRCGCYTF